MSLPPHKWGGAPFLPPIFQTHGGGHAPPSFQTMGGEIGIIYGGEIFLPNGRDGGVQIFGLSPPIIMGGDGAPPHNCAAGEFFFGCLPPIYGGKCRFFAKLCLILGMCTPPYRMGGRHLPPIFSDDGGGIVFSPPYFQTMGGDCTPPYFP